MNKMNNSWWFRMKPRSILKTLEWFPYFALLEGEDWNKADSNAVSVSTNRSILITRRKYILSAHPEEVNCGYRSFMNGEFDSGDIESQARNDKASFEFYGFGYVDLDNIVRITKVGRLISENRMTNEIFLKQLLKIQFISPKSNEPTKILFPMQVFTRVVSRLGYLRISELAFIFGCTDFANVDMTIQAIQDFRCEYDRIKHPYRNQSEVKQLFVSHFLRVNPTIDNKPDTYLDYADSFTRALMYTGLFMTRGRSTNSEVYIPIHAEQKVRMLDNEFEYKPNLHNNTESYMNDFGDPFNIILPWDNITQRKEIVNDKLKTYSKILSKSKSLASEGSDINYLRNLAESTIYSNLVEADERLSRFILGERERDYIESVSKEEESRNEIIEKFNDILNGNDDLSALWLEVNTWRSLISINGKHTVKRNFQLEEDLTPRSFAPGIGNTPDMEMYFEDIIILPEVSLMSGVKQWEHEGSSVIDHVLKFKERNKDKNVYGLFLTKSLNVRLIWQYFILNKESWIGDTVPVIPLTIKQYIEIIEFIYEKNRDIESLIKLVIKLHEEALVAKDYKMWHESFDEKIKNWKKVEKSS
jgi:hypothetical protein